jgi:hypothetical protein
MECEIKGCDKQARARGWCSTHYGRWWKYGDPEAPLLDSHKKVPIYWPAPGHWRHIDAQGYVQVRPAPNNMQLEHRAVMEVYLERPLRRTEIVHHIDGNRSNNDIKNLQILKVNSHAAGQNAVCLKCGSRDIGHEPLLLL